MKPGEFVMVEKGFAIDSYIAGIVLMIVYIINYTQLCAATVRQF